MTLVDYVPTTGVQCANKVEGWFYDHEEIDPEYELECLNIEKDFKNGQITEDDKEDLLEGLSTNWDANYVLYGDWKQDPKDHKWEPDENGTKGFSAKFNRDVNTIQILWSKWAVYSRPCSPCYPMQGDVDSPGISMIAYCLPPEYVPENDSRTLLVADIMDYENGDTSKEDVKRVKFFSVE